MRFPERAVLYAMTHRLAGSAGGLITAALVATCLSPELQGYYYTFLSILTWQTFVDLGFGELIQQSVSHEWARLKSEDRATRENARMRLGAMQRFAFRWYGSAALILVAGLGSGGVLYFHAFDITSGLRWELPWAVAVLATGAGLLLTPVLITLEGTNQVEAVHGTKLLQSVGSRLASAAAILGGAGLLAIAASRLASLACGLVGLHRSRARAHWSSLTTSRRPDATTFRWKRDIWPLQWKLALSWLSGYLLYSLFTPILFAFHGPELAGRMGLTLAAASAIGSAAFAVVATKVPRLAMHAATSTYREMDALFRQATRSSVAVAAAGAAVFFVGLVAARELVPSVASRFLPPFETAALLVTIVLQQVRYAIGSYLRAHKEEPLVLLSAAEALVALPLLTLLGKSFGATGMVAGFLALTTLTLVPAAWIFERCRTLWHNPRVRAHANPL